MKHTLKSYVLFLCFFLVLPSFNTKKVNYHLFDKAGDSEVLILEFLKKLNSLYQFKTWDDKNECEKYIMNTVAQISTNLCSIFGIPDIENSEDGKLLISYFLQQLKKKEVPSGKLKINGIAFCQEVSTNGYETYTYAQIEVQNNNESNKQLGLMFTITKDPRDDIKKYPFKIINIKVEDCTNFSTSEQTSNCAKNIAKAESLVHSKKYQEALSILQTLVDCQSPNQAKKVDLISYCEHAIRTIEEKETAIANAALETQTLVEADELFENKQFQQAKEKYIQLGNSKMAGKIKECNKCIKGEEYLTYALTSLKRDNKIGGYHNLVKANDLCPFLKVSNRLVSIRNSITNAYIQDTERLMQEARYLDALFRIRKVFEFDENNLKAKQIEEKCSQYNQEDFIISEITKAKRLFENPRASAIENATAYKILSNFKDSKYMDGEGFAWLGLMELQPKKYGLHKEFSKRKLRAIKSNWEVNIFKGMKLCKKENCNDDANYVLGLLDEELFHNPVFKALSLGNR